MDTPSASSAARTKTDPSADAIFYYDEAAQTKFQQEKPWVNDPHYFKRVKISALALLKMVVHARSGGTIEADAYEYMVDYSQTNKQAGRLENVVGWYHSHPGYGCWLSGIDVSTQMLNQQFQEPFLAVVIDPTRTVSAGKVDIGAFRTYPEGYKPADDPISDCVAEILVCCCLTSISIYFCKYYSLDITYLSLALTPTSWIALEQVLGEYPFFLTLLGNGDYVAGQISDLAEKLEQAENHLSHSRFGPLVTPTQRKKDEESQLAKITRDSAKITVEQVHGLMSQVVIKDILFNSVQQSNRSNTEPSGPEPMIES
ncbi:hypothetical protein M0R45_012221 [Rubus argutus]|uniref:COP9 signalosome complex subunit 5 n=1 Tax=Rubus argutus TaxID=59490 RepID=A0AAW1YC64_RUBAR